MNTLQATNRPLEPPLSAMRSERDRFVALAFCWADLLIELDDDRKVIYAAGAVESLTGVGVRELTGRAIVDVIAPDDRPIIVELLNIARKRGRFDAESVRLNNPARRNPAIAITGYKLDDLNGHFFVAMRRMESVQEGDASSTFVLDEETGLVEGDGFIDMVIHQLAAVEAGEQRHMSLIALPGYEDLQERLAETVERRLLSAVGECLRTSSAAGQGAARLGSDRYGLIHGPDLDMDTLKDQVAGLTRDADPASTGISPVATTIEIDPDAVDDEHAAEGLNYALDQFRSFSIENNSLDGLASSISALAKQAIGSVRAFKDLTTRAEFRAVFEPIVDARTGAIYHYEALARFPDRFGPGKTYEHITFAERSGLIVDFDLAMTSKVIQWLSTTPLNSNISVAVNVSGKSVTSLSYLARLSNILEDNPWTRGRLMFEITESARMDNLGAAVTFIQRLRERGYQVCLDDFGAGAANFGYLASLDVDIVKLDGSAVLSAQKAHKGKAFLKAFVGLCRELGVATVAEMIEDETGLAFVRECGVNYVQGYLFGHPAPDIHGFKKTIPAHLFARKPLRRRP